MRLIANKTTSELHPHTMPSTNIYMAPIIFEAVESIGCSRFSIFHRYHMATGVNRETFDWEGGGGIISGGRMRCVFERVF